MLDGLGLAGLKDFKDVQGKAFDTADDRFAPDMRGGKPDRNDNHNDAFRHTYWNALMTKKYGAQWTEKYATTHETRPGNTPEREAMDLYNNELGRRIAQDHPDASEKELADLVEKAVQDGDTVVVEPWGRPSRLQRPDQLLRDRRTRAAASRETATQQVQRPGWRLGARGRQRKLKKGSSGQRQRDRLSTAAADSARCRARRASGTCRRGDLLQFATVVGGAPAAHDGDAPRSGALRPRCRGGGAQR
ncbi:DUF6973 domain-containing protein [Streptomyces reniochalinae]